MTFRYDALLKRDAFSETEVGHFDSDGEARFVRRRLDRLPLWSRGIGRYLAAREARALARLSDIEGVPRLIRSERSELIRSWLDGVPLQQVGNMDARWAQSAHQLLREIHRRGVTHNDLAKPQNWLVMPDGRAAMIDFQLAQVHRSRGRLFRLSKYEDLRHILKQKRRFAPELLTPTARRMLERRSLPSRIWRATAKPVYNFVTRKVMNWSDNEGAGAISPKTMAALQDALLAEAGVTAAAVVPVPRAGGMGLYAFVEAGGGDPPRSKRGADFLQVVEVLPRRANGEVWTELLALVAENRVDELHGLMGDDPALAAIVRPIEDARLNLTDRYIR